jgi:hypothetical protein
MFLSFKGPSHTHIEQIINNENESIPKLNPFKLVMMFATQKIIKNSI